MNTIEKRILEKRREIKELARNAEKPTPQPEGTTPNNETAKWNKGWSKYGKK